MRKLLFLLVGILLVGGSLLAQSVRVTGKVVDPQGIPLPNVSIVTKGASGGTTTNENGDFSLNLPAGANALVFSFVGYESKTVAIVSGTTVYNVQLKTAGDLESVIVTGYTREKKSDFVGATSKVGGKLINDVPIASVDQILQGRAPGVTVLAGTGQPGSAANVIIRGVTSISGTTTPLYIMDGIPIEAASFASLSPSEIESVDVLKDAGATALYGSRGANGVIVITTKRGRSRDRVQVGLKSQYGVSIRTNPKFVMMNSQQRIQFEEEVQVGPGWTLSPNNPANASLTDAQKANNARRLDSLRNMNVDWTDIFFRNGKFQEHELSASGGTQNFNFYSSLNYYKQDGIALRSSLERYSLRNNLDFRTKRLNFSLSSSINYSTSSFIENENTTAITNPFAAAYYALPYEAPYINGTLVHPGLATQFGVLDLREGTAALERVLSTTSKRNELKAILGTNFSFKITDYLSVVSTAGIDFQDRVGNRYIQPGTYTGGLVQGALGSFNESTGRILQLTGNAGISFDKTFANVHKVSVTVLYESIKRTGSTFGATGFGLNPLLGNTPAAITAGTNTNGFIPAVSGGRSQRALQSAIATVRYTYDGKYVLNGNVRRDGSSTIGPENRFKYFYSVGAGWNIFREDFMQNVTFVDALNLRASYGLTASPFTSEFGYLTTFGNTTYNGQGGLAVSLFSDPNYDWEYTGQLNAGIDFAMLKNRLRGTIDVYRKNTFNLFVSQVLSATAGSPTGSLNINAGKMRNSGVELMLSYDVVANKDVLWTIGGNVGYNKNIITDLGQVNEFEQGTSIIRVGLPIGSHYIPLWGGVDPSTGDPLYYNRDKSLTRSYNAAQQSVAESGTWLPKFVGGFNSTLNYKNFTLDAFFSFSQGSKRFNNEDFFNENQSFLTSNQSVKLLDRWRQPGDITNIQRINTPRRFTSKDIQDASFLRFRNLTLAYNVPTKALTSSFKGAVSAARIFVQGQNLYTWTQWTGFDPEDSNNISAFEYPVPRTLTVGLNVTF